MQEVDGYVALTIEQCEPAYLDPLLVSRLVKDFRDLQARALRGVRWDIT